MGKALCAALRDGMAWKKDGAKLKRPLKRKIGQTQKGLFPAARWRNERRGKVPGERLSHGESALRGLARRHGVEKGWGEIEASP